MLTIESVPSTSFLTLKELLLLMILRLVNLICLSSSSFQKSVQRLKQQPLLQRLGLLALVLNRSHLRRTTHTTGLCKQHQLPAVDYSRPLFRSFRRRTSRPARSTSFRHPTHQLPTTTMNISTLMEPLRDGSASEQLQST